MSIVEAERPAGVPVSVSVEIGGREITFETGKLAKQADGAVVVSSGQTVVLGTAQGRTEAREGADFFPLTVDVEERMYAAGKIPGGFFKREGRPTERAILTARMIDRPVRPLWPKGYRNETQCVGTVFSADLVVPHDILAINAVSAALHRLAAALPRADRRGADGLDRGQPRRQPDARGDGAQLRPRPDRRRHEGRPDHGRGGREPRPRERHPGGARDRAPRDREALRCAARAAREGRQDEVARPGASPSVSRASTATRSGTASRSRASARQAAIVEEIVGKESGEVTLDSDQAQVFGELQVRSSLAQMLEKQRSVAAETRRSRAVRERPARAHGRRAGLEGAEVREAEPALRPDHRDRQAALPGRRRGDGEPVSRTR